MARSFLSLLSLLLLPLLSFAQFTDSDGYTGYKLDIRDGGDPESVLYETLNTQNNVSALVPEPDVLVNASVWVGEINIEVQNLSAKINLDAQVLNLLQFNAGVDLSINRVFLLIQNVSAKVYLEARLENLVEMINDTLTSIDLNPIIAELGNGLGEIVDDVGDILNPGDDEAAAAAAANEKRGLDLHMFQLSNNILYSVNDYSGNTHTNRVLAQNGDIVEQKLDNFANPQGEEVKVGDFRSDMRFNGFNMSVVFNGEETWETEWVYEPFVGLWAVAAVFERKDGGGVVGTRLLAEARGGGSSTIGGVLEG
ncbi:hypothetical protein M011DRAFT_441056 [Sporormia fimetaria CBS 119925]|uniref:Uncharacterized protein n=1 Tax=Sporormia fimetaria CBS 119925 TaxID=1340428 RepID=A0A6A6VDM0_9PLEO|nr:hypothetical protein M011DRAFT_441056 [Sporormia fimetaria CBS 119925]